MPKLSDTQNIDVSSDESLLMLKIELDKFNKPKCNNLEDCSTDDVVKDLHRAIYGNGGSTQSIIWKLSELSVRMDATVKRETRCRTQVEAHLIAYEEEESKKKYGPLAVIGKYPKLAFATVLLLILGTSSLCSIIVGTKQANKVEQLIAKALVEKVSLAK